MTSINEYKPEKTRQHQTWNFRQYHSTAVRSKAVSVHELHGTENRTGVCMRGVGADTALYWTQYCVAKQPLYNNRSSLEEHTDAYWHIKTRRHTERKKEWEKERAAEIKYEQIHESLRQYTIENNVSIAQAVKYTIYCTVKRSFGYLHTHTHIHIYNIRIYNVNESYGQTLDISIKLKWRWHVKQRIKSKSTPNIHLYNYKISLI